jgi:Leucine-rich repeat (LRR) protein
LEGLTDLRYLSARDCGLTDISVLSDIKTLEYILLGFNEITNVPP